MYHSCDGRCLNPPPNITYFPQYRDKPCLSNEHFPSRSKLVGHHSKSKMRPAVKSKIIVFIYFAANIC